MNNTIYRHLIEENKALRKTVNSQETVISLLLRLVKENCDEQHMQEATKLYKEFSLGI